MSKNYLDKTGLARLWEKITSSIATKQNKITYGSAEPTGGEDGDIYLMTEPNDAVDKVGDLSTLTTEDQSSVVAAINELNNVHYMAIGLSANVNVSISSGWSYPKLAMDTVKRSVGTGKLIHQNNTIVIGKGVKYVRVSASLMCRGIASTALVLNLKHNSTYIAAGYFYPANTSAWGTITTIPMIIGVKEGDVFQLDAGAGATGTLVVAGGNFTLLNIEVVG